MSGTLNGTPLTRAVLTVPRWGIWTADVVAATGEAITVSLPVSKATIASRLSLTPEYFSRVLHELEGAGLITIDKRDIHILDPQRLAHYQSP
jgi:CRP-like cAMP-binding protein